MFNHYYKLNFKENLNVQGYFIHIEIFNALFD